MHLNSQNKQAGFTLLEVLIAICILAFISIGIYQAVTETYKIRDSLSSDGDFYNGIRLAMNIVQRDVTLIYSPVNLIPTPAASGTAGIPVQPGQPRVSAPLQQQVAAQQDPSLGQTSDFWGPALNTTGIRPSRFIGSDTKMSFISNSHLRVYKDSPESEFAKITYEVLPDEISKEAQMLVKTENIDAFNLEKKSASRDPFQRTFALLHGIKKFKYRYYWKEKDEWLPSWDSDKDETKNVYPDIVELTLELDGPQRLSFEGRFLFKPELPLRALNPSL